MNSNRIRSGSHESGNRSQNERSDMSFESINYRTDSTPIRVLLVDDQPEVLWPLINFLEREGYKVKTAERAEEALKMVPKFSPQIVFLDVKMPGMNGLEALEKIRAHYEHIITFIMTGNESIKDAVQAIKTGAYDYFSKPYHIEEIKFSILKALKEKRLMEEISMLRKKLEERYDFDSIITADPKMFDIFERLRKVAVKDLSILITGENGTGKELLARAIHCKSNRKDGPFIPIDCAAIPDSLFESEMFGYDKGAFTGADKKKKGLFEMAHRGTLFLDELGNLKTESQCKLLRVIQEHKILPLGGKKYIDLDLRLISATNKDLEAAKDNGYFREDLFFRINQFHVHLPPLREKPNDIILLARHFLNEERLSMAKGKELLERELSPEVVDILRNYSWPGNIRQLKNVIQGACALAEETILPEHLPPELLSGNNTGEEVRISFNIPNGFTLKEVENYVVPEAERLYIERVLMECNYKKNLASIRLNINQKTLSKKMEEYNIKAKMGSDGFARGWVGEFIKPGMTLKDLNEKIGSEVERPLIINGLFENSGNKAKAARKLEIDYKTLNSKMDYLNILKEDIKEVPLPDYVAEIIADDPSCSYKQIVNRIRQKTESSLILMSLDCSNWDKAKAARALDIDYKTIYNKISKYSLIEKQ
ncbi:MAG: sigma 54-interacting transcriptional regulator [bacterium]